MTGDSTLHGPNVSLKTLSAEVTYQKKGVEMGLKNLDKNNEKMKVIPQLMAERLLEFEAVFQKST